MPEYEDSVLATSTDKELENQSGASPGAGDAQSESAKIMHDYFSLLSQQPNQAHQKFTEESSEQIVDDYDEKTRYIIDASKLTVETAQAKVGELYKKYKLEFEGLNKAAADLQEKIALLKEM